jgi:2-methylcitrate dehydratase PrpD
MAGQSRPSLTETLGNFVAATDFAVIPPPVIDRAKVSFVHNFTMALAGRRRESIAHVMAKRFWPSPAQATLLHDGTRVTVEAAAFANGALLHARSQDDTHAASTSHPGSPVMAAALAVAEMQCSSGAELLAAIVLGYEVLGRIGRDFDHLVTERGFRAACVFGAFGAAAAAAKLLSLSGGETAQAIALAAHMAAGLSQVWEEGSPEFPLQLGFAARNGILAARAAQAGATAARHTLEGKGGFYRAYAGTQEPAREALAGLGTHWQIAEATVKAYPVCAILQGPVASMLKLIRTRNVDPVSVTETILELGPYEAAYPGIDNCGPFASSAATKMSAQFSLGLALTDQALTLEGLSRLDDAAIGAQAKRVRVVANAALVPRASRLRVRLADGTAMIEEVTSPGGQPDFREISAFAHSLIPETDLAQTAIDHLLITVASLERAPDLSQLFDRAMFEGA